MDPFLNTTVNTSSIKLVVSEAPAEAEAKSLPPETNPTANPRSDGPEASKNRSSIENYSPEFVDVSDSIDTSSSTVAYSELPESELKPNSRKTSDELMKVVSDPHAPENVWLSAWKELKGREQSPSSSSSSSSSSPNPEPKQSRNDSSSFWKQIQALACVATCMLLVMTIDANTSRHRQDHRQTAERSTAISSAQSTEETDIDFGPYMAAIEKKIRAYWKPPGNYGKIVASFRLHRNGTISKLGLDRMMHYTPSDLAALKAIEDASDFPPLPPGAPEWVDVSFTFDYNVEEEKGRK